MTDRPLVYDLDRSALGQLLAEMGEPSYRTDQVWNGLYQQLAPDPFGITTLSKALRQELAERLRFSSLTPQQWLYSSDGMTGKVLFNEPGGRALEAVLMRYKVRRTACISTQVGCGMGCVFCATGQMGLKENLSAGQIVEQVLYFARQLRASGDALTNVVVMGMGEPFHNYDATLEAMDRLNDPQGFNFGARRITISTVGLVPMIERFTDEERPYNLAVSLHAANDPLRESMIPINKRYPLKDLMRACRRYVDRSGRRITFEWALVEGVNDSVSDAQELADLVQGMICHVNLIPLNPTRGYAGRPTESDQAGAFRAVLEERGISATVRVRRGIDIQAGCGQLAVEQKHSTAENAEITESSVSSS